MSDAVKRMMPLFLALALLAGGPAGAQEGAALDKDSAGRAVAALEDLSEAGLLSESAEPQPGSDEANLAASIIREHGFSPAEWMAALHGVTDGYVALKAQRLYATPGAEAEFEAMRQSILDNPNIDDTTRRQALEELERRIGPQVAESPLVETVAPFEQRLDKVFDGATSAD
ncbi:hypothetical protein ACM64Y_14835 [Novispirillum sp. DQ9]|uniref:hypothetical protein n=1 Tax=Novispirillum sp. DQ9 TaxID=3398612 RepID=UPI003C7C8D23